MATDDQHDSPFAVETRRAVDARSGSAPQPPSGSRVDPSRRTTGQSETAYRRRAATRAKPRVADVRFLIDVTAAHGDDIDALRKTRGVSRLLSSVMPTTPPRPRWRGKSSASRIEAASSEGSIDREHPFVRGNRALKRNSRSLRRRAAATNPIAARRAYKIATMEATPKARSPKTKTSGLAASRRVSLSSRRGGQETMTSQRPKGVDPGRANVVMADRSSSACCA